MSSEHHHQLPEPHFVREAIVYRAIVRLADALANFAAELWTEAGPYPPAGPVLAKIAKLACSSLAPLLSTAVVFRTPRRAGAPDAADGHVRNLQDVLEQLQQCALKLDGTVGLTEEEAFKRISECRKHIDGLIEQVDAWFGAAGAIAATTAGHEQRSSLDDSSAAKKVIVEFDLARYGDLANLLEDTVDVAVVARFNSKIHALVADAIREAGADPEGTVLLNLGDGGFLAFDGTPAGAAQAHRFVESLHRRAESHNNRREPNAHFHFRIGISAGPIILRPNLATSGEVRGYTMAGMVIAHAVRLEAACGIGEVLISSPAWRMLPDDLSNAYGNEEPVAGKRGVRIMAHRRAVGPCPHCTEAAPHSAAAAAAAAANAPAAAGPTALA